jgi:hypothetical protein
MPSRYHVREVSPRHPQQQKTSVHHLVNDDRMSELDGFEALYSFMSYGPVKGRDGRLEGGE